MSSVLAKVRGLLFEAGALRPFQRDVAVDRLRVESTHIGLQEGYGGQPIERFPPWTFFHQHVLGEAEPARAAFALWYEEQFRKYRNVSKDKGGMHRGSLYHEVLAEHASAGAEVAARQPEFRDELVAIAIERRVAQRIAFLEGIRSRGYRPVASDPIFALEHADGTVHLLGGHHRAAALSALGESMLPRVTLLTPRMRDVFARLRILR